MKALCSLQAAVLLCATPVLASVTVSKPINGATVNSPFTLTADSSSCSSQSVAAIGYSLDTSSNTTVINSTAVSVSVTASLGSHVLHVKSWGKKGASCVTSIAITVVASSSGGPSIPSTATVTKAIQNVSKWTAHHDAGTSGSSTGAMDLLASPSLSGSARKFATSYNNYGGERYNVSLAVDPLSTHFVYDTRIYLKSPSSDIANIEMDLNQVMSNGHTVIFGFQCDSWSHTWDYAENIGTPAKPVPHWVHSNQSCNLQKWSTNAWHRVQVKYARDSSGNVTYDAVWFDGKEQNINVTVNSDFDLGWGPSLNSNFQIDGFTSTSGSSAIYLDDITLYSW
jgi:hypothetical protein